MEERRIYVPASNARFTRIETLGETVVRIEDHRDPALGFMQLDENEARALQRVLNHWFGESDA